MCISLEGIMVVVSTQFSELLLLIHLYGKLLLKPFRLQSRCHNQWSSMNISTFLVATIILVPLTLSIAHSLSKLGQKRTAQSWAVFLKVQTVISLWEGFPRVRQGAGCRALRTCSSGQRGLASLHSVQRQAGHCARQFPFCRVAVWKCR